MTDRDHRVFEHPARSRDAQPPSGEHDRRSSSGRRLLGLGALLLLLGGLAVGVWRHYALHLEVIAAAEQHRDFVPSVRVEAVRASAGTMSVALPATTNAFQAANIYARASGYITERNVDIGSRVRAGDLLAAITAPELDHQIAQAEASLAQAKASRRQTKANRELARVTWGRDSVLVKQGWATQQQGDTDRLNYAAQQQAKAVNDAAIRSQEAQLLVLRQQKAYQQVVAPFDGIVTQRNIDVGSLVQADATSGTFMFALTQSDVMRVRLYVPQDAAIGVKPGVDAVVRVPSRDPRPYLSGQGRADRQRPRSGHSDPDDRDRRTQPRRRVEPGDLLHGRAQDPAPDAITDRACRRDRLRPRRSPCIGGRERRRAQPQDHRNS
jgi:RND family efflux transporter MFP subunit